MVHSRKNVVIQGLGFAGAAMCVAVSAARSHDGDILYDVIGVEKPTDEGSRRAKDLGNGVFPFATGDRNLEDQCRNNYSAGNVRTTTDPDVLASAGIVVVDINLDLSEGPEQTTVELEPLREAIREIGSRILPGTLVLVETTTPPGTMEKTIAPELSQCFEKRGLARDDFLLAYSYERVMPGTDYLESITNYWRVYSGLSDSAADACEIFLESIIDTDRFPLFRLPTPTASETAKVLENAYRAVNIAFIDEWSAFAESAGIDLFEIIDAIGVRPSHSNIRRPGLGVGGHCLPKDPLFGLISARQHLEDSTLEFPLSIAALTINKNMPNRVFARFRQCWGENPNGKRLLVYGVTYKNDVADTRLSPAANFTQAAIDLGMSVVAVDPYVPYWPEMDIPVVPDMPPGCDVDAVALLVAHNTFSGSEFSSWLGKKRPFVFDACGLLTSAKRSALRQLGIQVDSVGRGKNL